MVFKSAEDCDSRLIGQLTTNSVCWSFYKWSVPSCLQAKDLAGNLASELKILEAKLSESQARSSHGKAYSNGPIQLKDQALSRLLNRRAAKDELSGGVAQTFILQ